MDDASNQLRDQSTVWKPAQTYVLAAVCLVIGLAVGYFLRGSASSPAIATATAAAPQAATGPVPDPHAGLAQQAQQKMPSLDQMKQMADKQAGPLLAKLKTDPKNADLLNQVGTLYRATHQFKTAIWYYRKSLDINPENVGARTDMASCMYYLGDIDSALAQLDKSLSYDPRHAGTLINIGIIKWKAKNDANGAVSTWEKMLRLNPDFQDKGMVEQMIAKAKEQKIMASAASSTK